MSISVRRLQLLVLLAAAWLIYWGASWAARVQLDAMIYGGLAKVIVQTGDWARLHYTSHFFPEFYEHPPLVIWLAAALFHLIPATDLTQKILPFIAAMGTLAGILFWGARYRSHTWAFTAGLILLSSTRFVKYSSSLMLDPFLTVFLLWSIIFATLALEPKQKASATYLWSALSGLMSALAFLSKGMPALAGWAVSGSAIGLLVFSKQKRLCLIPALLGYVALLSAPFFVWAALGDGFTYLQEYWTRSVSRRLASPRISDHFLVFRHLLRVYWPWLPFAAWSLFRFFKSFRNRSASNIVFDPFTIIVLMLFALLTGFSASGYFLEHYSVPLYPFLALLSAEAVTPILQKVETRLTQATTVLVLLYALVLATLPISIRGTGKPNHLRALLETATKRCSHSEIRTLQIGESVDTNWMAIALGRWYTPWNIIHANPSSSNSVSSELLIVRIEDLTEISSEWSRTSFGSGSLVMLEKNRTCSIGGH